MNQVTIQETQGPLAKYRGFLKEFCLSVLALNIYFNYYLTEDKI